MLANLAVLLSALMMMGVIAVKMVTTHLVAAARSELAELGQAREEAVERWRIVKERRIAAEGNRDFLERRKSEQLVRREQLTRQLEEYIGQPPAPEEGAEPGQGGGMEPV